MIVVYNKKTGDIFRQGIFDPESNTPDGYAYIDTGSHEPFLNHKIDVKTKKPVLLSTYDPMTPVWATVRVSRDAMLQATDYLMAPDYPITEESRAEFVAYRQALRDLTNAPDPTELVWPDKPEVVKKTTASAAPAEDAPKA